MIINLIKTFSISITIFLLCGELSSSLAQNIPNDSTQKKNEIQKDTTGKTIPNTKDEFDQSGFNFGFNVAINGTFIVHQQIYGLSRLMPYSPTIKFAAGFIAGYNFDPSEGVVFGFGYCGAGQNYHDNLDGETFTKSVKMSYFQIPVMFKYIFNSETTQPYIMGGIQLGFLTSSSVVVNDSIRYPNALPYNQGSTSSTKFFQSTDLGFRFELGDDFMISNHIFFNAGVNVYIGLPDINNPDLRHEFIFRGNDYPYKKSSNLIVGIQAGIHYIIKE